MGDFGWGEEVADDDEAVALEGVEVWCGHFVDCEIDGVGRCCCGESVGESGMVLWNAGDGMRGWSRYDDGVL